MSKLGTRVQLERVAQNLYRHRGNKKYYGSKTLPGKSNPTFHGFETTDRKMADRQLVQWLKDLLKNPVQDHRAPRRTLADMLTQFRAERATRKDAKTEEGILRQIETARSDKGIPYFNLNDRFDNITPSQIIIFMGAMATRPRFKRREAGPISPRTYNYHALILSAIFEMAMRDGVVFRNSYKLANIKWKRVPIQPIHTPTLEEFQAIVTSIRFHQKTPDGQLNPRSIKAADFVEFEGLAGLGQAETGHLKIKDVDLEKSEMQVLRIKTQTYFSVPIYPRLRPLLARLISEAGPDVDPETRLFKILDPKKAIEAAIRRLNKKGAKMPNYSQRTFRQMAVKNMLKAGVPIKLVSEWQAHRDGGKLILERYSRGMDSEDAAYREEALKKLA